MINLYHAGFLPKGVNKTKLHRWPWIYLHGEAEAPEFKVDEPDIFLADIPLDKIDDGIVKCQLHIGAKITRVEAYIWSRADEVRFSKGQYSVQARRLGLVISAESIKDRTYAYDLYSKRAICI